MLKPQIYFPLNSKYTKPNNALVTESFKNQSISLLDWLGIDLSNGSSSLVLAQDGTWVSNGSPTLTFNNALTKTSNTIQLGGDLIKDTTIETDGNDFLKEEVASNIKEGIYDNPVSANRSWNVEHSDNNSLFLITNKIEGLGDPFSNNCDFAGNLAVNLSNEHIAAAVSGYDNVANSVFSELVYIIGNDTSAARLDANGFRVNFNYITTFTVKPNNIVNVIVPEYADNAAALAGTLVSGDVYKTTTGGSTFLKVVS